MCTNKFSIGRLIGVNVISTVKLGYQDNFEPVYYYFFFYKKTSRAQKAPKRKTSNFHTLKSSRVQKIVAFVVLCLVNFALLVDFFLKVFLCLRNLFVKKKLNKQAWNCLDNLILLYYSDFYSSNSNETWSDSIQESR